MPFFGETKNKKLHENIFKFANPVMCASPLTFYSFFTLIEDVNNLPPQIATSNDINVIIEHGIRAFSESWNLSNKALKLPLDQINLPDNSCVIRWILKNYENPDVRDKEITRMVKTWVDEGIKGEKAFNYRRLKW